MSILGNYIKQPAEVESYSIDYAEDLGQQDGIASAIVTVTPTGLTIDNSIVVSPRVKVFTSGGVDGVKYKIEVTATTDDGRVLQDEFYIRVKDY